MWVANQMDITGIIHQKPLPSAASASLVSCAYCVARNAFCSTLFVLSYWYRRDAAVCNPPASLMGKTTLVAESALASVAERETDFLLFLLPFVLDSPLETLLDGLGD